MSDKTTCPDCGALYGPLDWHGANACVLVLRKRIEAIEESLKNLQKLVATEETENELHEM